MPTRVILEALAVGASAFSVLLATLQVERQQLPRLVLWLAVSILAVAVIGETFDFFRIIER